MTGRKNRSLSVRKSQKHPGLGAQFRHEAGMASSALSPLASHLCEGWSLRDSICLGLQGQKPMAGFVPVEAMTRGAFNVLHVRGHGEKTPKCSRPSPGSSQWTLGDAR